MRKCPEQLERTEKKGGKKNIDININNHKNK